MLTKIYPAKMYKAELTADILPSQVSGFTPFAKKENISRLLFRYF